MVDQGKKANLLQGFPHLADKLLPLTCRSFLKGGKIDNRQSLALGSGYHGKSRLRRRVNAISRQRAWYPMLSFLGGQGERFEPKMICSGPICDI
jgi:hypothetical protein